jgi:DNA-binding response OmpR family regulator
MSKILLVEDSKEIYQMVMQSVSQIAELTWASNIKIATDLLADQSFDLAILDVELPDGNGIEFCSSIQAAYPNLLVFILTSHANLSDKVMGFSAGADDYITKPFSPLELRARLEARLRKTKQQSQLSDSFKWKELQINKSRQEVFIIENDINTKLELTALEFKLLLYFAMKAGEVIDRDKILNDIWGADIHVYQRSVDTHVSKLRKKLGGVSHILQSIHGSGYKFSPTSVSLC